MRFSSVLFNDLCFGVIDMFASTQLSMLASSVCVPWCVPYSGSLESSRVRCVSERDLCVERVQSVVVPRVKRACLARLILFLGIRAWGKADE